MSLHEKSKQRVRELGEVYTPPGVANDMLDLLDQDDFHDINTVYFEPSCGNGNICIEILRRRLGLFGEKTNYSKSEIVAICIENFWAIDVCAENISETRQRVLDMFVDFMKPELDVMAGGADTVFGLLIGKKIEEHIFEADFFSSMKSCPREAEEASHTTRMGRECYLRVGHRPMPFLSEGQQQMKLEA